MNGQPESSAAATLKHGLSNEAADSNQKDCELYVVDGHTMIATSQTADSEACDGREHDGGISFPNERRDFVAFLTH